MIVDFVGLKEVHDHDVCVVGSGPIGLALALSCVKQGLTVLLLESGLVQPDAVYSDLGRGTIRDPAAHVPLEVANCRALGGTSHWWGGRCVPLDPVDFEDRPAVPATAWPISHADLAPYYAGAAAFFRCGPAVFSAPGPWTQLSGLRFDELERWCPDPNMGRVHADTLMDNPRITVVLGATVTDLRMTVDRRTVTAVTVASLAKPASQHSAGEGQGLTTRSLPVRRIAICCGGVQTPRLLLALQRRDPTLFGGIDGPLGRFYMGHIAGKIADIVLDRPKDGAALDFYLEGGAFARRRFTLPPAVQRSEDLLNTSFTAGNARVANPDHRNGALSLIWLTLASPLGKRLLPVALRTLYLGDGKRAYRAHLWNVLRTLIPTVVTGIGIVRDRHFRKPGKPGVFLQSQGGRYSLFYQSEQMPHASSRISLSTENDAIGLPRADVHFSYTEEDARRVVRAHEVLDRALRANRIGRIEFNADFAGSMQSVLDQARDGMHQIGATRMSDDPQHGVVDRECRVHGFENLFIASSSVFPSSGHANPTFAGVALALRLSNFLVKVTRGSLSSTPSASPVPTDGIDGAAWAVSR